MAVPQLYVKESFDAEFDTSFRFGWTGDQSYKNRLVIKNNLTNVEVYNVITTTFQLIHTVPANTLTNGVVYNATITSFNSEDIESSESNTIVFKCFSNPILTINITNNQVIENSSYVVELSYSQSQGELLNSYQVFLYDSGQSEIYSSDLLYNTEELVTVINNLADGIQYYIQATGRTINGMNASTGLIPFSVSYMMPSIFSLFSLENKVLDGAIKLSYNMIIVTGACSGTPTYIDNQKIDLTNGTYVDFDGGFELNNDFIIQAVCQKLEIGAVIMCLDSLNTVEIKYMTGTFASQSSEKAYFILRSSNGLNSYSIYSNYIDVPTFDQNVYLWIERVAGLYNIKCEILGEVSS